MRGVFSFYGAVAAALLVRRVAYEALLLGLAGRCVLLQNLLVQLAVGSGGCFGR